MQVVFFGTFLQQASHTPRNSNRPDKKKTQGTGGGFAYTLAERVPFW
jgi:hypothetical protein